MGRSYSKATRKRGETWQEMTRLAKDRKEFRIRLMQPDAWKGKEGLEK
jgi:hypothetical protein